MIEETPLTPRRPRLLLSLFDCNPSRGSESAVGWNRAVESAKYFDTWVICDESRNKRDIQRRLETSGEIPGLHFEFIRKTPLERLLRRTTGLWYLSYNIWQRRALVIARQLHNRIGFDLVHHVTCCGYREPGHLWKLDVPFVWGPVGGTQNYPWQFLPSAGMAGALKEGSRGLLNILQLRFSPRVRKAATGAAVLMTANTTGQRDFQRVHKVRPLRILDVGINAPDAPAPSHDRTGQSLRLLWVGNLKYNKALHLLIEALSKLPDSIAFELRVVGGGPVEARWRRLARRRGVDHCTTWLGHIPHSDALRQYEWADVFVFTSLRDTCGSVILEALSRGVPVICFDHQGAGDVVTDRCGIKIPVTTPSDAVARLRDAIVALKIDRTRLDRMSSEARRRANDYLWSRQGERMVKVYHEFIENVRRAT